MKEINELINEATQEYLKSDKLQEFVQDKAKRTINDIVDSLFSYSGPLKKALEEEITSGLSINRDLGLSGLNKFINEEIVSTIKGKVKQDTHNKIIKTVDQILRTEDKNISAEHFMNKVKEFFKGDSSICSCDNEYNDEYFNEEAWSEHGTIIIEDPGEGYNWLSIYIDPKPNKSIYDCRYELTVHEKSTSYKLKNKPMSSHNVLTDYIWDLNDYIMSLFLNDTVIDLKNLKEIQGQY